MDLLLGSSPAQISSATLPSFHLCFSPPSSCFKIHKSSEGTPARTAKKHICGASPAASGWDWVGNFLPGQLDQHGSRVTLGMFQGQETLRKNQPQHLPAGTGAAAGRGASPMIVGSQGLLRSWKCLRWNQSSTPDGLKILRFKARS